MWGKQSSAKHKNLVGWLLKYFDYLNIKETNILEN